MVVLALHCHHNQAAYLQWEDLGVQDSLGYTWVFDPCLGRRLGQGKTLQTGRVHGLVRDLRGEFQVPGSGEDMSHISWINFTE